MDFKDKVSLDKLQVINEAGIKAGGFRGGAEAVLIAVMTALRNSAGNSIHVESTFGSKTRQPFVTVSWGESIAQLDPDTARQLAIDLLEAAEASISDAFLIEWLQTRVNVTDQNIQGQLLAELRKFRRELTLDEN